MPSSPVRIAATRPPSQPTNSAVPACSLSTRRAIRSSGSVVTTHSCDRVPPSGATSQASQCPSAECMTLVTGPSTGKSTSRDELARQPRRKR